MGQKISGGELGESPSKGGGNWEGEGGGNVREFWGGEVGRVVDVGGRSVGISGRVRVAGVGGLVGR